MSKETSLLTDESIARVQSLAAALEKGDSAEAERVLDELASLREKSLFQDLGRLTREFHEALQSFRLDSRIATMASEEFPNARERLKHVVNMTAQSADRTMSAVEGSMPICDGLEQRAQALKDEWGRFTKRKMNADEFRDLSKRLAEFLDSVGKDSSILRNNLQEVLMAQDFQDLTGQIIQRVVKLVDEVESNLVELVRISGQSLRPAEEKKEDRIAASGPPVPGVDKGTVAGQDEVDDLLSSLGF